MRETAYAKVNLALHVRGREPDGYHRLETVFAFAEDGDDLTVQPQAAGEVELRVVGPFAAELSAGADNLVVRAAQALRQHHGVAKGACIVLDKRLPLAAGIGGGSADAAAALRLLTRFWGLPHEPEILHVIARSLGADVPACLASRTVRGEGRGDDLVPIDSTLAETPILLVNPRVPVPTGPVFKAWDGIDRGPLGADLLGRNDLEVPALTIAPVIADVLKALVGAGFARMSGSGATCFALYGSDAERDEAQARISVAHPDWWTLASRLRR
ncbi:MAG: 4-(cytidine 5'-diphospho)-2-C-methyl-D-erythritol kinase [Allosphingosinicella sp.]|uniref:4-(cytidine 5'-diphospho)-2-C-methyl-D-erythritol kinase n=1 Tax=Allosphingosinicella sp. TaxID=2823234 RepID=UPI003920FF08